MNLTILREGECRDLALSLVLEVGHVQLLLQVPDLDIRVSGSSAKDQTVGMELEK